MSTFVQPATATSGLQGYDLEGAKRGPKEPGKSDVIGTLYIKRRVRNAEQIIEWAKANGFATTLEPDDMHVTIAYSKKELAWKDVAWSTTPIMRIVGGTRKMKRLGQAGEAAVLGITSDALNRRHYDIRAVGASWAYPSYQPHITLSYDAADVDFDKITPFDGDIELGPEEWALIKANWMAGVVEKAALKAAGIALIHDGKALFLRRATGGDHGGEWNFPGGGIEPGENAEAAAIRETFEEAGYTVPDGERVSVSRTDGHEVDYTTFVQHLDAPFIPTLNDEHDAYQWAPLDRPPDPLHPGVRAILSLVLSAATSTVKAAGAALVKGASRLPAANREDTMDNLSLFVQLRKVDAKERIVYGTAAVEEVDRSKEIFDYATSKPNFEKWSETIAKSSDGKSLGNVRAMHGNVAAGKLVDIGFDDVRKAIDVAAKIVDDNEWQKVEEGVYTGFSIGGSYAKKWNDGVNKRYTAMPREISLVDMPCGPSATFSMIKADGSEELRKFATPAAESVVEKIEISNEMVAARATELAKAAGDEKAWLAHIEEARKALEIEAAASVAKAADVDATVEKADGVDETALVEKTADDVAKDAVKTTPDDIEQVWTSKRLPGQTFAKKADLSAALIKLDAKEEAEKAVADVLGKTEVAAPAADAKPEGETVAKADATADEAEVNADRDALIKDIAGFVPGANHAVKRQLMKQADVLGMRDVLPEGWIEKAVEGDGLAKGATFSTVADMMYMLSCVQGHEYRLGDDWGGISVPDDVKARFHAALVALGDVTATVLDLALTGLTKDDAAKVTKSVELVELIKRGARNSANDKGLIKTAHDALASLDKDCCGSMDKSANTDDLAKADLVKAASANDELTKALGAANDKVADLTVRLDATKEANAEAFTKLKADSDEKVAKIATLELQVKALETEKADLAKTADIARQLQQIRFQPASTPPGTFRTVEKGVPMTADLSKVSEDQLRQAGQAAQIARLSR